MSRKRILILGGSAFQIPLIQKAKEMGLYVITCDYLSDNPGHHFADEYHNVSTTDKEAVLELAKELDIQAIASFSSDPAMLTIAYISEAMNLAGPTIESIEKLTEKDKFREVMKEAGLPVPAFFKLNTIEIPTLLDLTKKYIVKPVDSSGSKGIRLSDGTKENLLDCIEYAFKFSRAKRCIIEEFIDAKQIHGDGFLIDGKLEHYYLGDHFFYTNSKSFIPSSTRWPSTCSQNISNQVAKQVEAIALTTGYLNGPINIEARITDDNKVYIIEVGPRNGGNFVPIVQQSLTGFNFVDAVLHNALGQKYAPPNLKEVFLVGGHHIIHAKKDGLFKSVDIDPTIKDKILFLSLFKKEGDQVFEYSGSNTTIGVCLFNFTSLEDRDNFYLNIDKLIKVKLL